MPVTKVQQDTQALWQQRGQDWAGMNTQINTVKKKLEAK
jgi:hypothetical protein